jgi:anti-sigma regulatory factor (Ser/Thr protein kinase)
VSGLSSEPAISDRSLLVLDRRVENVAEARHWLDAFLAERDVAAPVVEDATLIVSELVTNALVHGRGVAVLRAAMTEDGIQVSVTDSGDELPLTRPLEHDPVGREQIGGLGLNIVERVATSWGVASFPGGKTVWATVRST